jgi:hypothetical protein
VVTKFRATAALAAVSLVAVACPRAAAQEDSLPADAVVLKWLNEAPRREIPAKVAVTPPRLTFDQRLAFNVFVTIPARQLQAASAHRDLYMVVKASDGSHWLPTGSHTHYELTQVLDPKQDLEISCTLHARPGHWVIGVILYDDVLKQRTTFLRSVTVDPVKNDPLPRLEADLPPIEFDKGGAAENDDREPVWRMQGLRQHGYGRQLPDPSRRTVPGHETGVSGHTVVADLERNIAVNVKRPIEMDVLVDFTPSSQYSGSNRILRWTESTFWQVTQVLTALRSTNLCTRVTGVDITGRRVLFRMMDGSGMDWPSIAEELAKINANTVDVETLEHRTQSAQFVHEAVDELLATRDAGCPLEGTPEHIYVIAASGILFPTGTASKPIEGSPSHLYYLRANLLWNDQWDAMAKIVKPLRPRLLSINDPLQFRKALAEMVKDLEGAR